MKLSLFDREQKARTEAHYFRIALGLILLSALLLTPLSIFFSNDVLLQDTVLPLLTDFLLEIINYLFFWAAFASLLYVIYRYGTQACVGILEMYAGAVLLRYLAYLLAGYIILGFPPSFADAWQDDLVYLLIDVLMDLAQMGVVFLCSYLWMGRNRRYAVSRTQPYPSWLPYRRMLALNSNPLLRSAAVAALLPSVLRVISRVIYDLSYGAAVSPEDLLWQIFSYTADVAYILVGYLLILLFLNSRYLKDTQAYAQYCEESAPASETEKNG